jgi:hypothetical protein
MNEPIKVYFYPFSVMTIERSSLLAHHYTYAIHAGVSVVTPRRHPQEAEQSPRGSLERR